MACLIDIETFQRKIERHSIYRDLGFALVLGIFAFTPIIASGEFASSVTVTPINTVVSSDGREIVSDFYIGRSDGTGEIVSARFGDNVFQYSGISSVPATSSLPLIVSSTPVGQQPGPGTTLPQSGEMPARRAVQADPEISKDDSIHPIPPLLIYIGIAGGGAAVSAATCAAGWFLVRRTLISDCEAQGGRFLGYEIGTCGVSSTSTLHCEERENPEPPPPENWIQFSQNNLPWSFHLQQHILDLSIPNSY